MKKITASLNQFNFTLVIIGIITMIAFFSAFVTSFKPIITFEDILYGAEVKIGSHIEGNVVFSYSQFAYETTETKDEDGKLLDTRVSGNYYIVPMGDNYLGLKTNQGHVFDMNNLVNET